MNPINEGLMQEWKELRDEIARKQNFVERLILTTVTGDLLIFSFAATQQISHPVNAFIALTLPVLLTTLSYFWILRYFYSGARISKYIKDVIEPKTGLNWENFVNSIRKKTDPGGKVRFKADTFSVFFHSLIILALLVYLILIWSPYWQFTTVSSQSTSGMAMVSSNLNTYIILSGIGVVFWIIWYLFVRWMFINETLKDTRKLFSEMQGVNLKGKNNQ